MTPGDLVQTSINVYIHPRTSTYAQYDPFRTMFARGQWAW